MQPGVLIAVDQGTTNTKALLVDREGRVGFSTSVPMTLSSPQPGFMEQDPVELWNSVATVLCACAAYARESGWRVEGIAISNQRETALAWHGESGLPLAPAVGWQCKRSAAICEREAIRQANVPSITGLPLDPLVSAGKWTWMLENLAAVSDAAKAGTLRIGTVDSWLLWCLSGGKVHATDTTNASRTALLNLGTMMWDAGLMQVFDLPADALPGLRPSSGELGVCSALPELEGVPIVAMIGDSHAAMVGHGRYEAGTVKATYGTGSSLMMLTASLKAEASSLARTVGWTLPDKTLMAGTQFALEGNIAMTGAGVQWVADFVGLKGGAHAAAEMADEVESAAPIYFVPAMVGLGAPHWDADARGLICGLQRGHTTAHVARAAVEAIAFQVADVLFAMEAAGGEVPALLADGGAVRNSSLMQFQADLLGVPVHRSRQEEVSALGAAMLGGLALGWWTDLETAAALPSMPAAQADVFLPRWNKEKRDEGYKGWELAVRRARLRDVEPA
jgi:glycerol kinase